VLLSGAETPGVGTVGCSKLRETATGRTGHGEAAASGTLTWGTEAGSCGALLPAGTVTTNRGGVEFNDPDGALTTGWRATGRDWDGGLLTVTGAVADRAVGDGLGEDCLVNAGYETGGCKTSTTGAVANGNELEGCGLAAVLAVLTGPGSRCGTAGGKDGEG
jgi:hypothetical protein